MQWSRYHRPQQRARRGLFETEDVHLGKNITRVPQPRLESHGDIAMGLLFFSGDLRRGPFILQAYTKENSVDYSSVSVPVRDGSTRFSRCGARRRDCSVRSGEPEVPQVVAGPLYKDPGSLKFAELQASYTLAVSLLGSRWLSTIVDAISGCPLAVKLATKVYLRRHNNFMAENYGPLAFFTLYTNYAKVTSTAVKAAAAATKAAAVRAAASAAMARAKIAEDISIAAAGRADEAAGAEQAAADIEAKAVATVFQNLATSESSIAGVITTETVTT
ncbi:hypothetical protein QAD02_021329 [Eretmocerus hayati]|uniref:Uncharacterized protein n=1 Tax=Eretmocerus hayati TaxID=131215 RepID=A0ACC2PPV4_9HYME|nr:hypothetical protein QAD02_021329 [Eretmocerus hayati]